MPDSRKETRDKWLHLRVSATELVEWKKLALSSSDSVADYVRSMIGHKLTHSKPRQIRSWRKVDPLLIASIGRLGNNLNQIAHWCNTYKSAGDATEVIASLVSIENMLMTEILPIIRKEVQDHEDKKAKRLLSVEGGDHAAENV